MLTEQEFKTGYHQLLKQVHIEEDYALQQTLAAEIKTNPEVKIWLSKLCPQTHTSYLVGFTFFLRCINLYEPSQLLDLKGYEDKKNRFFPAEQLMDYWLLLAKEKKVPPYLIKKTVDSVRSFFKHNRVKLEEVTFSYKPKDKPSLGSTEMIAFRDCMTAHGRHVFDFLLSVPLRDGQFSDCKYCGRSFHPRWGNLLDYPKIEMYGAFVTQPEKGHESDKYSHNLRQVCFLTQTAANQLNSMRYVREKALGRKLTKEDYIFTFSQDRHWGKADETPLHASAVRALYYVAQEKAGFRLYPHLVRSYVNTVLAACGIDKQVRDIYLGHSCCYDMGYIMQMIPVWREQFQKRHVLETLDILNPSLHEVAKLEQQLNKFQADKDAQFEAMKNDFMRLMDERLKQMREGLG